MLTDFLVLLFENVEMLIALSAISQILSFYNKKLNNWSNVIRGLIFGAFGILIMTFPYSMSVGVTFDTRSILLSLTAMMFGFIPMLISSSMMLVYRIILGGSGMTMGLLVISSSALIGLNWNRIKVLSSIRQRSLDFYLLGLSVHVVMVLWMFFLPQPIIFSTMRSVGITVLILYPLVTVIIGQIFKLQITQIEHQKTIQAAENKFRSIFTQAPAGIGYTSFEGDFVEVNEEFASMLGYSISEIEKMTVHEITYHEDWNAQLKKNEQLKHGELTDYSLDQRYLTKNGSLLWVQISVSKIRFTKQQPEYLMLIAKDITSKKESELFLEYIAYHDQLTDCYNGRYYDEFIQKQTNETQFPISIIIVNVNGLKIINEAFGYKAGDALLQMVAVTIKQSCEDSALITRNGSNEFVVIYHQLNEQHIKNIVFELNQALDQENNEGIKVSVSLGYATWKHPKHDYKETFKLAENRMLTDKIVAKNSMFSKTIDIIINTLFEKNNREMLHSKRVSVICEKLAQKMGFNQKEIDKIKIAGLMHDIGKIGISDEILNKNGKLNDLEWIQIKGHSDAGYRILSSAIEFSEIAECVLTHHERWDGKGYPKGLIGTDIPLFSRIIGIADAFDAMTSSRAYREPLRFEKVISEMQVNAGRQFDPEIVGLFLANIEEFRAIS